MADPPQVARVLRIGSCLLAFRDRNGWDTGALAVFLDCDAAALARLALMPMPNPGDDDAIRRIAGLVACDPETLRLALAAEGHPSAPLDSRDASVAPALVH